MGRFTKIEVTSDKLTVAPDHLLELTDEQAVKRNINLKRESKGIYRVLKQVEFKRGEVIGFEYAMLPKADRARVITEEKKAEKVKAEKAKKSAADTINAAAGDAKTEAKAEEKTTAPGGINPIAE
jgi:hypothetical protein